VLAEKPVAGIERKGLFDRCVGSKAAQKVKEPINIMAQDKQFISSLQELANRSL